MTRENKKWIALIIVAALLGIGAAGFMFLRGSSNGTTTISPTPTEFIEEPTPTEEPMVNKADLKVKILNGSGVVGEAGKVQKILEGADFTVESTGNADAYDHKTTEIQAKSSVSSTITDELTTLLGTDYTPEVTSLGDDEDVDIIIVVGARKNAPTAKPTAAGETTVTTRPTGTTTVTPTTAITATVTPTPTKIP